MFNPRIGRWTQPDPHWGLHNQQSSTNAILQSGNLFMFAMHNPVRWSDPLGLFAWNEADDHWFNLQYEVINAGGSYIHQGGRGQSSWQVSVFGVNVSFNSAADGMRTVDGVTQIRADLFYSTVVGAAQEMIFLGAHGGVVRFNPIPHLHISMFAASGTDAYSKFYRLYAGNVRWGGVRFATISGGASNEGLTAIFGLESAVSAINRQDYLGRAGLSFINHLHTGTGMISQLFDAHNHFSRYHSGHFTYRLLPPLSRPMGFNSTSVTISLLRSVGLDHGMSGNQQNWAVGIDNHIHPMFFGR